MKTALFIICAVMFALVVTIMYAALVVASDEDDLLGLDDDFS